jgi:hypothetical protein
MVKTIKMMKTKIILLILLIMGTGELLMAQQQDQEQNQDKIRQEDHYRYFDGQLFQYRNGVQSRVMEQQKLNNGIILNPDGSYQLQNQEKYQLRKGECLDRNGLVYKNQNRFNKGRSISSAKINQRRDRQMIRNKSPRSSGNPTPRRRAKGN